MNEIETVTPIVPTRDERARSVQALMMTAMGISKAIESSSKRGVSAEDAASMAQALVDARALLERATR